MSIPEIGSTVYALRPTANGGDIFVLRLRVIAWYQNKTGFVGAYGEGRDLTDLGLPLDMEGVTWMQGSPADADLTALRAAYALHTTR